MTDFPEYQATARMQVYRTVRALKIASVDGHRLTFADSGFAALDAPAGMFAKWTPDAGDYYVEQAPGLAVFTPGRVFEATYKRSAE